MVYESGVDFGLHHIANGVMTLDFVSNHIGHGVVFAEHIQAWEVGFEVRNNLSVVGHEEEGVGGVIDLHSELGVDDTCGVGDHDCSI